MQIWFYHRRSHATRIVDVNTRPSDVLGSTMHLGGVSEALGAAAMQARVCTCVQAP